MPLTRHSIVRTWLSTALLCAALACTGDGPSGPYEPQVCDESLPLNDSVVATRLPDGTILLTEGGVCGLACECSAQVSTCNWEVSGAPEATGVYEVASEDVGLLCIDCAGDGANGTGESGAVAMGTVEIVRVDDTGVAGCLVATPCGSDARFEATWCP